MNEQAEHRDSEGFCWLEAAASHTWESAPEKSTTFIPLLSGNQTPGQTKMCFALKMQWKLVQLSQSSGKQYINTLDKQTFESS